MLRPAYHTPRLSVVLLSLIKMLPLLLLFLLQSGCKPKSNYSFSADIGPLVHKNCSPCHRPGGGAPFALLNYEDVAKRAKMIAYVTGRGYMPPWPADRHYSRFLNERLLSAEEIQMLRDWYEDGCAPGDLNALKPYVYTDTARQGKPDLVLHAPAVKLQADNQDRFYVLKLPVSLPGQRYVRAVEFVPGQPSVVHHVNGHYLEFNGGTDPYAGDVLADIESSGFEAQFARLSLRNADGSLPFRVHSAVNYLPGASGLRYPAGIGGFSLGKQGAFVFNDIHYGPSRKALWDSSKLYVYFADKAPKRPTFEVMMGTNGVAPIEPPLQVPAGTVSTHVSRLSIYSDISVLTVNPHMHLIGKWFKAYALKPNGDTLRLIHIPAWQFRWQYFYTYARPLKIPKGSTIVVEAGFDNTARNPNNPFSPPRHIGERLDRGGASMRSTDEMLQFIITYMPYQKGDENIDLSKP